MRETLILGVGNLLLSDDGAGVHGVQRLQAQARLPEHIHTLDGGTLGMALLPFLEGITHLLILDAVHWGGEPGELVRLSGEEVREYFTQKISLHELGIAELLQNARLLGLYPEKVVLWGIQPQTLDVGLELSPPVSARLDDLLNKAVEEVSGWLA